jgi:hypothetical protein
VPGGSWGGYRGVGAFLAVGGRLGVPSEKWKKGQ